MNHYLIMYVPLRPEFVKEPTPEESAAVESHFEYLKGKQAQGSLVLAGRTEDARYGIAIIKAESEEAAREIMANDPAVKAGVFSGDLQPFRLSLGGGK